MFSYPDDIWVFAFNTSTAFVIPCFFKFVCLAGAKHAGSLGVKQETPLHRYNRDRPVFFPPLTEGFDQAPWDNEM